jgi:general secretion pathway protein K
MTLANKISGSALLTALFIMTLVAIVATAMSTRLQLDIYRTRALINYDKLSLASQAVTIWSMAELRNPKNHFTKMNQQGMVLVFPKNMTSISKGIQLSGGIYDLQSRFNLNNLVDKKYLSVFLNLLDKAYPNKNQEEKVNLSVIIKNWISPYDLSQGQDELTAYYQTAYNPSHQLLSSFSEFRLMKNISAALYLKFEPLLTTLPETTAININTAPKSILMALGNGISANKINEFISIRAEHGIASRKEFHKFMDSLNLPREQVTINSSYFLTVAIAQNEELKLVVYSLFKRNKNNKGALSVALIRESINTW